MAEQATCRCGGTATIKRHPCHMPKEERGWDYLASCTACPRRKFGYTKETAVKRIKEEP